jgi:hypothetical protein
VIRIFPSGCGAGLTAGILLLGAAVPSASGQEGAQGFSLGLDLGHLQQADDLVSPLRYSGATWRGVVRYGFSGRAQLREASLSMGLPVLTSSRTAAGGHRQEGVRASLSLGVFQRVAGLREGSVRLYLGGEVRGEFAYYDHWYTSSDREAWLHLFGLLQPGGAWRWILPGVGELRQVITLPVGGVVLRPGYQGMTEPPRSVLEGWGRIRGLHQTLQLLRPLGVGGVWGITYEFAAVRYPDPRPLAFTRHSLGLRATVWGGGR